MYAQGLVKVPRGGGKFLMSEVPLQNSNPEPETQGEKYDSESVQLSKSTDQ
jgi:hypothetical protein